jgi:hypothetical protein
VSPVFANNSHRALTTDDLAFFANLFNGSSNFHFFLSNSVGGKILSRIRRVESTRGPCSERAVSTYQKTVGEASIFGANRPTLAQIVKADRLTGESKAYHLKNLP